MDTQEQAMRFLAALVMRAGGVVSISTRELELVGEDTTLMCEEEPEGKYVMVRVTGPSKRASLY